MKSNHKNFVLLVGSYTYCRMMHSAYSVKMFTLLIFHFGTRSLSVKKKKLEFAESKLKKNMWVETEATIRLCLCKLLDF